MKKLIVAIIFIAYLTSCISDNKKVRKIISKKWSEKVP
jgi:hypothetical protein